MSKARQKKNKQRKARAYKTIAPFVPLTEEEKNFYVPDPAIWKYTPPEWEKEIWDLFQKEQEERRLEMKRRRKARRKG